MQREHTNLQFWDIRLACGEEDVTQPLRIELLQVTSNGLGQEKM
jgi:hypothetical protein